MVEFKATAIIMDKFGIEFEFGRIQAEMYLSRNGRAARKLKLKDGDKVKVTVEKL